MSRQLETTHITGCYEYRSPIRRRVNVESYEKRENEESMIHTTTTTSASHGTAMGNSNKKFTSHSFSADDLPNHSLKSINNKDVAKWSSADVQYWIKKQCKKYELKKSTAENFEMNGQALMLLNKNDFIRRSPEGGEILYYNLQHLINPNKINSARLDQSLSKSASSDQHARIVEVSEDTEEFNRATSPSSPKPIVEEPDDPPVIRRSQSDTHHDNYPQQHPQTFFFHQAHVRPSVVTMTAGSAAAYFHQQQGLPNGFVFAQHQPHLHMHQPFFFQPHLLHQYHPMMSAQGILIEIVDDTEPNMNTADGINGSMNDAQPSFYMVTINGQRFIMNEGQVRQLVTEVYQRQTIQENLQRQHLAQQQQLFQQQQQQHFIQQQLLAQQQQRFAQQQHFQQQAQPQRAPTHFQQQERPQSQRF